MIGQLRQLYPAIEAYQHGLLAVDELHQVYFEQCGNPEGKPVVFLHGGPGGGGSVEPRRFFDPEKYRIILIDQRGCGRSLPHAELHGNTTWDLVGDIEKVREQLGIERWMVFGGSWGSTLALAYAQQHPERVTEMVLRGIFLLRRKELLWFYQEGCSRIFPDAWQLFLAPIPEVERFDLMSAYYRRLTSDDAKIRLQAAQAWSVWEGSVSHLYVDPAHIASSGEDEFALAFARIEAHYFVHGGFFEHENQLLDNMDKIAHIPAVIVQGRYDVVCPATSAWDLHTNWPGSELHLIADAGHSAFEPGIVDQLIKATDRFAKDA